MAVELFHRDFGGTGFEIVLLHGLFGSSKNWSRIGRHLSRYGHCYGVDQRNHGESAHHPAHRLDDLIEDLDNWIGSMGIERPVLLGHSMGGTVAMGFALGGVRNIEALIVVDIAPKVYRRQFNNELQALRIDLSPFRSRGEIDRAMVSLIPDAQARQFLQMNLGRGPEGFYWKINTRAIEQRDFSSQAAGWTGQFTGPALFVVGGKSPYVGRKDYPLIQSYFPEARIECIPEADHWLHYRAEDRFKEILSTFFAGLLPDG